MNICPLANHLKKARLEAKLSQKELGIAAGIDPFSASPRIKQYETGKHTPDFLTLKNLAEVDGGFVYLAAIIDWYSKAILAYKISNTMDESLVLSVLKDALGTHKKPKIFNTDQGSQYTSNAHVDLLTENDIQISMDGKGRATDNIAIERFWRSAKYENIYLNMRLLAS